MTYQYKACPRCQTRTSLQADRCDMCGRQFRTKFSGRTESTLPSPVDSDSSNQPKKATVPAIVAIILSVFLIFMFFRSNRSYTAHLSHNVDNSAFCGVTPVAIDAKGQPIYGNTPLQNDMTPYLVSEVGLGIRKQPGGAARKGDITRSIYVEPDDRTNLREEIWLAVQEWMIEMHPYDDYFTLPKVNNPDIQITKVGVNSYEVSGWAGSLNQYNVYVRNEFSVKVSPLGDKNWLIEDYTVFRVPEGEGYPDAGRLMSSDGHPILVFTADEDLLDYDCAVKNLACRVNNPEFDLNRLLQNKKAFYLDPSVHVKALHYEIRAFAPSSWKLLIVGGPQDGKQIWVESDDFRIVAPKVRLLDST